MQGKDCELRNVVDLPCAVEVVAVAREAHGREALGRIKFRGVGAVRGDGPPLLVGGAAIATESDDVEDDAVRGNCDRLGTVQRSPIFRAERMLGRGGGLSTDSYGQSKAYGETNGENPVAAQFDLLAMVHLKLNALRVGGKPRGRCVGAFGSVVIAQRGEALPGACARSCALLCLEIDPELLTLFIEMTSFQAERFRGGRDVSMVAFQLRQHGCALKFHHPRGQRA